MRVCDYYCWWWLVIMIMISSCQAFSTNTNTILATKIHNGQDYSYHDTTITAYPRMIRMTSRMIPHSRKHGHSWIPLAAGNSMNNNNNGTTEMESKDDDDSSKTTTTTTTTTTTALKNNKKPLVPKIGDIVRFYDLDGGNAKGQELVGKITFLTKTSTSWLVEVTELDNLGDGYFAEYSSIKRQSKKTNRDISQLSPIAASYVRTEQAYKVPLLLDNNNKVKVRQEQYDFQDWSGPQTTPINIDIVQQDGIAYQELKFDLIKNTALFGLIGTIVVNILKGSTEDALIYGAGSLASVLYLFFLSIKTDTLASPERKLGNNISNLRFIMPVLVIVGVALYNQSLGDANPIPQSSINNNPFERVTPEQFASAILGFLTYRIPLILGQIQQAFMDDNKNNDNNTLNLPGSAGVALQLAKDVKSKNTKGSSTTLLSSSSSSSSLTTVLVVSGPQYTGRSELVQQLLQTDSNNNNRLVQPIWVDKIQDGATFERLLLRDEFLQIDATGRYGLTKDSILQAAKSTDNGNDNGNDNDSTTTTTTTTKVVVIDANVSLVKELVNQLSGTRLIGVWVGLDSVEEFESRIQQDLDTGMLKVGEDDTPESVKRGKMKEIIKEIEYGLSSGIFEFTILNTNPEQSLQELQEAASYCFK